MRHRVCVPSIQHLAHSRLFAMYGIATASSGTLACFGSGDHSCVFRCGSSANAATPATIAITPTTKTIFASITLARVRRIRRYRDSKTKRGCPEFEGQTFVLHLQVPYPVIAVESRQYRELDATQHAFCAIAYFPSRAGS